MVYFKTNVINALKKNCTCHYITMSLYNIPIALHDHNNMVFCQYTSTFRLSQTLQLHPLSSYPKCTNTPFNKYSGANPFAPSPNCRRGSACKLSSPCSNAWIPSVQPLMERSVVEDWTFGILGVYLLIKKIVFWGAKT